jgi:hypothetical protein
MPFVLMRIPAVHGRCHAQQPIECLGERQVRFMTDTIGYLIKKAPRPRAILVPRPCLNLTRFHGVFAPIRKYRVQVASVETA